MSDGAAGRIVGRYVLYDEIASGGMARIHLGRLVDPVGFSRTIAIKRLHPQLARDPQFVAKFLDEARLASRVRHPSVVSVIDVVTVADELFLVMEYVHGDSLARLLRAAYDAGERPIPLGVGLTIVADALYGLHAAHETTSEQGDPLLIVHRDVSPQNVLVGVDGVARVVDFGIAKAASQAQTQSEVLKGKLSYMSPEQFKRAPIDRRADIFAASIVLWEVVTGERLFAAEEAAGVLHAVLVDAIPRPSSKVPDLPPAVEAIVMKGLERDPEKRFATAHEMAAAIEATGLLVRPAEIGAWVARTAGDALRDRAERIAEIERDRAAPAAAAVEGSLEPTMMLSAAPRARRRWPAIAAAGALLVLGGAVGAARLRTAAPPAPPLASASAAAADPEPPPEAPPPVASAPPDPTASRVPAVGRTTTKRPPRVPKDDCSPPYYFDDQGVKRFKSKCL